MKRSVGVVFLACWWMMGVGCGRKATEADCQLIVDRIVDAHLASLKAAAPEAVEKKKSELRASLQTELKDCTGRRITDGIVNCVRTAATPDAVVACIK